MESHPNDITPKNLTRMRSMEIEYLSIGIEALQNHHLQTLGRQYTVDQIKHVITMAKLMDFECINVDLIFALPNQTLGEIEEAGRSLIEFGIDQVATYPLFTFPYTNWSSIAQKNGSTSSEGIRRYPLIRRHRSAATSAVRLLPSTNG